MSADGHAYETRKNGYNYHNAGWYNDLGHSKWQSGTISNGPPDLHANPGQYKGSQQGMAK